jgi:hypothetical protein
MRIVAQALLLAAAFALAPGALPAAGRDAASTPGPDTTTIPLRTVEFEGHRYVADVDLGLGKRVPLMIHGNSRLFLSITHAVGESLTGGPVAKVEEYGYSAKGKGFVTVARLRLGGKTYSDLRRVPVFDFTEAGDTLVEGMLGVPFLAAAGAVVDFSRDALTLGATPAELPAKRLLDAGYTATKITILADHRVTLRAYFPALRRAIAITPSTVSSALTLDQPLFAGKVAMEREASSDRSPSRTSTDLFRSDRVDFEIEGVTLHAAASFEDFAEYGAVPATEIESHGMLGYDWMKEHQAILDYAGRYLYFKP